MSSNPQVDMSTDRLVSYLVGKAGGCEDCGSTEGVELEAGRSAYNFDGESGSIEDPNRGLMLCREHARQHHDYWDAMWDEYNASRG